MKIRGAVLKSFLAVLACSLLFVAVLHLARNSTSTIVPKNSAAVARSASLSAPANHGDAKTLAAYGKLPLSFMENQGQTAQEVRYTSHGSNYDLFLTSQEAVVALRQSKHFDLSPRHRAQSLKAMRALRHSGTTTAALRMQLQGADPNPRVAGEEQLPGVVNYFVGNDPQKWHRNIPTYARVKYAQVYPGVDLVFYGNQHKLEYDFVVAPGADPNVIRMNLAGADKLRLSGNGDVLVSVAGGEVALQKPVVYQLVNGKRQQIAGNYSLSGNHVSFAVAHYDRHQPLVLDPVLNYSSYIGGGSDETTGYSMAVDSSGDAYLAGQTFSTDFPTKGGLSESGNANGMGFVTELNPTGTAQVFSTYLGGSAGGDAAFGLALDPSGNIYVTGETFSTDFPTNGTVAPLKGSPLSSNAGGTSFLTKFSPSGSLLFSTYLGGTNGDFGNAVAADSSGNAYVTGTTASVAGSTPTTFPVTGNAYQSTLPAGSSGAAFLSVLDTAAGTLTYSTYLGGDDAYVGASGFPDEGFGVVADNAGHAYITGVTASSDFPTNGTVTAHQSAPLNTISSAFVSEFDTGVAGTLLYSSYLGGNGGGGFGDFGTGIDLQSGTTVVYVTGVSNSASDFGPPTAGAYQLTGDSTNGSAYVTLTDTSTGSIKYSTYLGTGGVTGWAIKADATTGNALIAGAASPNALTVTPNPGVYQTSAASGAPGDAFVAEINPGGKGASDALYISYFGGSGSAGNPDQAFAIAFSALPTVFIGGQTFSTNLPSSPGVFQKALDGGSDAFIASLNLGGTPLTISATSLALTSPAIATQGPAQSVTLTNNTNSNIAFTSAVATTTTPAAANDFAVTTDTCTGPPAVIPALGTCTISVAFTPSVATAEAGTLTITDGIGVQMVSLTGTTSTVAPGFTLAITPTPIPPVTPGTPGSATVTVTSVGTFNAAVALSCAVVPKKASCNVMPASVTPAAGLTATSTLQFVTVATVAPPPASPRFPLGSIKVVVPVMLMLMIMFLFASEQRLRTRVAMVGVLLVFAILSGCSGVGSGGTPAGSYTVTVTGTSAGFTTQTATVSVTVQ
jgi:hypothetical protein